MCIRDSFNIFHNLKCGRIWFLRCISPFVLQEILLSWHHQTDVFLEETLDSGNMASPASEGWAATLGSSTYKEEAEVFESSCFEVGDKKKKSRLGRPKTATALFKSQIKPSKLNSLSLEGLFGLNFHCLPSTSYQDSATLVKQTSLTLWESERKH